jgi:hypothetical protein
MFQADLSGLVWESEEWLKENAKPLSESGGPFWYLRPECMTYPFVGAKIAGRQARPEDDNDTMEE